MIDWDRVLINVVAGLSILAAIYLLLIGYRYLLNIISTGKIKGKNTQFAELYTLLNNQTAKGQIQFYFILKAATNVKFSIVDKDENELNVLIDEEREAGDYPVEFDTKTLPDGIYFYQLKTELQEITKVFKVKNSAI
ncbi:MAG: hypothetical protein HOL28_12485 [Crocinitomicaceae bacterium]|nr:hypothetical protein [Crocinitomicaceae bacterium]